MFELELAGVVAEEPASVNELNKAAFAFSNFAVAVEPNGVFCEGEHKHSEHNAPGHE